MWYRLPPIKAQYQTSVISFLSLSLDRVQAYNIDCHQTCAVKRRSVQDSFHFLRNVIEFWLINLDQSKAFCRVSHQRLCKTLHAFGFRLTFNQWVPIPYTSCHSQIEFNGLLSGGKTGMQFISHVICHPHINLRNEDQMRPSRVRVVFAYRAE